MYSRFVVRGTVYEIWDIQYVDRRETVSTTSSPTGGSLSVLQHCHLDTLQVLTCTV